MRRYDEFSGINKTTIPSLLRTVFFHSFVELSGVCVLWLSFHNGLASGFVFPDLMPVSGIELFRLKVAK